MSVSTRSRTYTWDDPMALHDAGAGLSGLDYLKAVFERRLPPPPIAATLDFTGTEVEEGRAVFVGQPAEFLYNPIGVVHGGFAMTILDSAMGCAIHSTLAAGEGYTSLETSVNFVRPITLETGRMRCEGKVLHRGGRVATAEGRLVEESTGKLLAHGTTTCLVMKS
ncbi:MAG TPA: PaaI family thioesterase [Candidatus Dormibacteraeota bacterium]